MKILKHITPTIAIVATLLCCLLFYRACNPRVEIRQGTTTTKVSLRAIRDTALIERITPAPEPETIVVPKYLPAIVDTQAILADYFATRFYIDTIMNDTTALIVVSDSITQNRIAFRSFSYRNRSPTALVISTSTTVTPAANFKISAGFSLLASYPVVTERSRGADMWSSIQPSIAPSLMLTNRRDNSYIVTYDPFYKRGSLTALWKISFRKK
jgi:hypothetical protein